MVTPECPDWDNPPSSLEDAIARRIWAAVEADTLPYEQCLEIAREGIADFKDRS